MEEGQEEPKAITACMKRIALQGMNEYGWSNRIA